MTIETLKSPSKKSEQYFRDKIEIFISLFDEHFARHFESNWRETWRHTGRRTVPQISLGTPQLPPPPTPLHGTFNFVNIMHFLQGFSEIFLQEWSKYVCQTAFGEVLCKYWTEAMSYEYPLMWLWIRDRPPYRAGDYFPHSGFFSVAQNLVYVCVRVMRRRLGFIVLIRED